MNFDIIAFGIFILLMCVFLFFKRKNIFVQKILYPVFYLVMYKTKWGLALMDKISSKYRGFVILLGHCFIGFGFFGMIYVSISILYKMIKFFMAPKVTEVGMSLVLPGTNIPGIGYLSFFHFIIAIFILALVHEFAHGVLVRAYDLQLKSSGFAFFSIFVPFIPAAFVEPDEKKMSKRESYVQYSILSAGPMANVLLSLVFLLIILFVIVPIEDKITEPVGFSFNVSKGYPAEFSGIPNGMIVNSFNGQKVYDSSLFLEKIRYCSEPNQTITLGGASGVYSIITAERPGFPGRGFVGVENIKDEVRIKLSYEKFGSVFFWIKELFKWLYILNLLIGLVNLLPIFITDGAKMLLIALQNVMSDKKKAARLWSSINMIFVVLIIVGTASTYLKKAGLF